MAFELDVQSIMEKLPHRYPFLLVDRVLEYVKDKKDHCVKKCHDK
jgi:3-hydroxyacyl-[acyl-carrier-protein] dehydratase